MLECAPAGYRLPMDCKVCEHDAEARKRWGCDAPLDPAAAEEFLQPCPFCQGRDEKCADCKGSNRWPILRCPMKTVQPYHRDLYTRACLVESGVLPDAGGWNSQAAFFTAAYPIVSREIQRHREIHESIARRRAQAQSR